VAKEGASMVLLGKQAIDDDCNQTGQMLSALLNWPQGTFTSKLTVADGKADILREVDGGLETLQLDLPAIITVDLRLNEPRFASLPSIMKAKRKPIERVEAAELGVELAPRLELVSMVETPEREAQGLIVTTVAELVSELKTKACL
jgi:electron transfer flavoprotein beta subunit